MPTDTPHPPVSPGVSLVIGLGASAGGLQALEAFFAGLPEVDGMAFAIVLHLAADEESRLADVLQVGLPLPVTQVTEAVTIEPGHVYVIPPNKNLLVSGGRLVLEPIEDERVRRRPVDHLFRSLGEAYRERAAGVILSGTGSNGTVGVQRIRECGGLVLAQDPDEAEFDEMPRSAIAAGGVDAVGSASALAVEVAAYAERLRRGRLPETPDSLPEDGVRALHDILALLCDRTGHDFAHYKRATVLRRLDRRLHITGASTLSDYHQHLVDTPAEADALLTDLLISVTNFFRDRDAFAALEAAIPRLFEGKSPRDEVRVWVAGCATGEEAYSVGMLLLEHASTLATPPGFQVFATDLSDSAVRAAREGVYPESIEADVSPERLRRFFTSESGAYRVAETLRQKVLFAPHSLLLDPPFSRLDLVTCRNVLIYLQHGLQQQVLALFHFALRPGGLLLLGSSESSEGGVELFHVVDKRARLFRRSDVQTPPTPVPTTLGGAAAVREGLSTPPMPREAAPLASEFEREHLRMQGEVAPPSLLLSAAGDVLHVSASATSFLQVASGTPTRRVGRLLRPELRAGVQAALLQASREGQTATSAPVECVVDGVPQRVGVRVRPGSSEGVLQAVFDVLAPIEGVDRAEAPEHPSPADVLSTELDRTREQLQITVEEYETNREELKAQNEELQSLNEELRSTAEELETAKEEAQSMAEELRTANDELKGKVDETAQARGDLENLIVSTEIATLFLDRQLRIQRFTPRVRDHFHVLASDLGRPLADLAQKFGGVHLADAAEAVLDRLEIQEREVPSDDGRWFLVHLRPYRTVEDRIDGVVVTFVDITRRRLDEESLRRSAEQFRALVEASAQIVWTTDADGAVVEDSPSWRAFTGQTVHEWLGDGWIQAVHPQDRAGAVEAWRHAVASGDPFEREFRLRTAEGAWRHTLVRAVPLRGDDGAVRGWVGMNTDVTVRRQTDALLQVSAEGVAFRSMLADALRSLTDPVEVQAEAARLLGEHLGASRVHYAQFEPDGECAIVARDGARTAPYRAGRYRLADFATLHAEARAGRSVVVGEVAIDGRLSTAERAAFAALSVAALVAVPLVKGGRLEALLAVHLDAPRAWSDAEVALVESTAEQTWAAVERAQSEAARQRSEERYRLLVESATEYAFLMLDPDGRITAWSTGAERIFRYAEPDALGRPGALLFTDEDRAAGVPEHEMATAAQTGQAGDDRWHVRSDGSRFWASGVMTGLHHPDGRLRGFAKILRDNTQRKQAEDALRESEDRLQLALEASSIGTHSYDVAAHTHALDDRAREILRADGPLTHLDWAARVHPDDRDRVRAAVQHALDPDGTGLYEQEYRLRFSEGEVRWLYVRSRTLFDPAGPRRQPVRVVGTLQDVTDRKRMEEALRHSEDRFRRTAETVPDVLFTAAAGGEVDYVNGHFEALTGRPASDILGRALWDRNVHPDDAERTRAAWALAQSRNEPFEIHHRLLTTGGTCWVIARARPVSAGDGSVSAWFGTLTDVDDLKRTEAEVRRLNATLEDRVDTRTHQVRSLTARLAAAEQEERRRIAHVLHDDLQQQLAGLGITLQLLHNARSEEEAVRLRAQSATILNGAMALLRSLSTELSPPVLANERFEAVLRWLAEHQNALHRLTVDLEIDGDLGVLHVDVRSLLYQGLREILFNVVKHAGTQRARLRARAVGPTIVVEVIDEGAGFAPDALRLATGGGGFGLSSVRERLELVGGRLDVASAPGRGTTVTLTVPTTPDAGWPDSAPQDVVDSPLRADRAGPDSDPPCSEAG